MASPKRRGPKPLSDILGELFAARGYGRLRGLEELEEAWNAAVGEPGCRQTRVGEVRRGVLNVTVAHSTLLEELAAFRKPQLLAALRRTRRGRRSTTSGSASARSTRPRLGAGSTAPARSRDGPRRPSRGRSRPGRDDDGSAPSATSTGRRGDATCRSPIEASWRRVRSRDCAGRGLHPRR